jgi:hypothetical protein
MKAGRDRDEVDSTPEYTVRTADETLQAPNNVFKKQ